MVRILLTVALLLLSIGLSACGGAYTPPEQGITADMNASRWDGPGSLGRSTATGFRASDR